jgi:hypothetical protein
MQTPGVLTGSDSAGFSHARGMECPRGSTMVFQFGLKLEIWNFEFVWDFGLGI